MHDSEKDLDKKQTGGNLDFLENNEEFGIYLVDHSRLNFWGAGIADEDSLW